MRRKTVALAALAVFAVALAGCSSADADHMSDSDMAADTAGSTSDCTRVGSESTAATDLVTVAGEFGDVPDVDVRAPLYASETEYVDLISGTGVAIESSDQMVVLDISLVDGATGEMIFSSVTPGVPAEASVVSSWLGAFPGLEPAFDCLTEGTRTVIALSPDGVEESTAAGLGVDGDSLVVVIDVEEVYLAKATGSEQYLESHGLPTVVRAPSGQPGVIIPDAQAPAEPVSQVVIRGEGAEVGADDTIVINFTSVDWDSREVQSTSWGEQPQQLDLTTVPAEIVDALAGEPVGSQVMLVVPAAPEEGLATDTVYVFDILGIVGG